MIFVMFVIFYEKFVENSTTSHCAQSFVLFKMVPFKNNSEQSFLEPEKYRVRFFRSLVIIIHLAIKCIGKKKLHWHLKSLFELELRT